ERSGAPAGSASTLDLSPNTHAPVVLEIADYAMGHTSKFRRSGPPAPSRLWSPWTTDSCEVFAPPSPLHLRNSGSAGNFEAPILRGTNRNCEYLEFKEH